MKSPAPLPISASAPSPIIPHSKQREVQDIMLTRYYAC
jgi:hypothetical protein